MYDKSKKNALIFLGSQKKDGHTIRLANEFISNIKTRFNVDIIDAYSENISPCTGCNYCIAGSFCKFRDFDKIDSLLQNADLIVVASPVYNLSFPAPLKAIFDRTQPYFNQRFLKNINPAVKKPKDGVLLLSCGRSKEKCESLIQAQLNMIFTVINTTPKHKIILENTDFEPNFKECTDEIKLICRELCEKKQRENNS